MSIPATRLSAASPATCCWPSLSTDGSSRRFGRGSAVGGASIVRRSIPAYSAKDDYAEVEPAEDISGSLHCSERGCRGLQIVDAGRDSACAGVRRHLGGGRRTKHYARGG